VIKFNDRIASFIMGMAARIGLHDTTATTSTTAGAHGHGGADIVVLGYFRIARAFLERLKDKASGLDKAHPYSWITTLRFQRSCRMMGLTGPTETFRTLETLGPLRH
jgi:hypothetical protein